MVKLASVRKNRMYGPGNTRDVAEDVNAGAYIVAALLLLVGTVLLMPGYNHQVGFWILMTAFLLVVLVNLHDLYAHLAGLDFRLRLLTYDTQLALIELGAPLVLAVGGVFFFIGYLLLLRSAQGAYYHDTKKTVEEQAYRLLVAGPVLWLVGSIHNAFQVYEETSTHLQAWQKSVGIPFVVASTLLLVSGVLNVLHWPRTCATAITETSVWIAIAATGLLVLAAVLNGVRTLQLQQVDRGGGHLERLRGGAHEKLEGARRHKEPLLGGRGKSEADIESEAGRGFHSPGPLSYADAIAKN